MATVEQLLAEVNRRQRSKAFENFAKSMYGWQRKYVNSKKKITMAMCGNQVGKSSTTAFKASMHARGLYPEWYEGDKIEDRAPIIWVVGLTSEEVRDSIQTKLLGANIENPSGGMIPPEDIVRITKRAGVPGAADTIFVRHPLGEAQICLKTAEQGRERLQGATVDLVLIDEEPPRDVLNELVARVAKANGQIAIGFTALKGMTPVCLFLLDQPEDVIEIIEAGWQDAPHLSEQSVKMMEKIYGDNPAELESRRTGRPSVGRGQIYPFKQADYTERSFKMGKHWRRIAAIDVGWAHPTAALVAAVDDDADCVYVYGEYKQAQKPPATHASSIKGWGDIPLVMDPASLQSNKNDGTTLYGMYEQEFDGIDWETIPEEDRKIQLADNSVLSGIAKVYQMLDEGRLVILESCGELLREMMLYRWDEKTGKVVKKNDDLCDALRYLVMSLHLARIPGMLKRDPFEGIEADTWSPVDDEIGY